MYTIHGAEGELYDIPSMDGLIEKSDLEFFVTVYKTTFLFGRVQNDIKRLIDLKIIETDEETYPYKSINNSLKFFREYLCEKLGEDVVEGFEDQILTGLKDDEIRKGALFTLLQATTTDNDVEASTHMMFGIMKITESFM